MTLLVDAALADRARLHGRGALSAFVEEALQFRIAWLEGMGETVRRKTRLGWPPL